MLWWFKSRRREKLQSTHNMLDRLEAKVDRLIKLHKTMVYIMSMLNAGYQSFDVQADKDTVDFLKEYCSKLIKHEFKIHGKDESTLVFALSDAAAEEHERER